MLGFCQFVTDSIRCLLRSSTIDIEHPACSHSHSSFSDGHFSVAGPTFYNSLPYQHHFDHNFFRAQAIQSQRFYIAIITSGGPGQLYNITLFTNV